MSESDFLQYEKENNRLLNALRYRTENADILEYIKRHKATILAPPDISLADIPMTRSFIYTHIIIKDPQQTGWFTSVNGLRGVFNKPLWDALQVVAGPLDEDDISLIQFFEDPTSIFRNSSAFSLPPGHRAEYVYILRTSNIQIANLDAPFISISQPLTFSSCPWAMHVHTNGPINEEYIPSELPYIEIESPNSYEGLLLAQSRDQHDIQSMKVEDSDVEEEYIETKGERDREIEIEREREKEIEMDKKKERQKEMEMESEGEEDNLLPIPDGQPDETITREDKDHDKVFCCLPEGFLIGPLTNHGNQASDLETQLDEVLEKGACLSVSTASESDRDRGMGTGTTTTATRVGRKHNHSMTLKDFKKRMNEPSSQALCKKVQVFINEIINQRIPVCDVPTKYQMFMMSMEAQFKVHLDWMNDVESSMESLEKYVCSKMYDYVFASAPINEGGVNGNWLNARIEALRFVTADHLEIQIPFVVLDVSTAKAGAQLKDMNRYKIPRFKLICLVNSCKIILDNLQQYSTKTNPAAADDLLPVMIYVILKTNPLNLNLNLCFIEHYRNPHLFGSEQAYYYTIVHSAVTFIEKMTHCDLRIDPMKFNREISAAEIRLGISVQPKSLEHLDPNQEVGREQNYAKPGHFNSQLGLNTRELSQYLQRITSYYEHPIQKFRDAKIEDLEITDVSTLLEDYKRLANLTDHLIETIQMIQHSIE